MWVDEAIWGHRLYDEQTPWLTFLEFLGIVQTELEQNKAFIEEEFNQLKYKSYRRLYLRNILFNNPFLESVNAEYNNNDDQWKEWLDCMLSHCGGLNNSEPDFSYLQKRFPTFRDFLEVVKFLQFNAIEGDSNKRWSSKFVFPYGVDCLYEDLRIQSKGNPNNDRRFFARTGELLYLMICRSSQKSEILKQLQNIGIIDRKKSSQWNQLVALLQPVESEDTKPVSKNSNSPYLPYQKLDEFDNLAEDWLNLFKCNLPDYDSLPHLVTIMGVHLVLYLLKRSQSVLSNEDDNRFELVNSWSSSDSPQFILEIVAPKKTIIRDLASDTFLKNNNLTKQAIEHYIKRISNWDEWSKNIEFFDSLERIKDTLKREFSWDEDKIRGNSPDELLEELCQQAVTRHKKHVGKFHSSWTKEIGLASSRGSRRMRYAPTDSLLKTLVLCCVPQRREFQDFLEILYQKYGFIIGEKQATEIIERKEADQEAFADNAERLEQRLASLGLLKRLSDACAYVLNPYTTEKL
ncbi:hypothetical protein K4A83_20980 [Spirulina subsalsa FACHB-351]|uniref:Uncharacterized protein n=1 Tax=Spirulina subsalsa FACHB-351 TaxID=234711 RepID=A0ABT3LC66_9CYAN|nr:hypothetical protein [Spirulina subsalsa]MCW6038727.1 hypothetical protein [Spirulina subsalsa FACHB-351]